MSILQTQDDLFDALEPINDKSNKTLLCTMIETLEDQSYDIIKEYGEVTIASKYALDVLDVLDEVKKLC